MKVAAIKEEMRDRKGELKEMNKTKARNKGYGKRSLQQRNNRKEEKSNKGAGNGKKKNRRNEEKTKSMS